MLKTILIVDDEPKDILIASAIAQSIGIEHIDGLSTLGGALTLLERGLNGDTSLPDLLIVDLAMGQESGYELLRFWRTTSLRRIPLIVWSALGSERYKQVCDVFGVSHFVGKWEGQSALRDCLAGLSGDS